MNSSAPKAPDREPLWGRRIVALIIDWALSSAMSFGFFDYAQLATVAVFAVMTALLVGTAGSTIGHRLLGLGVRAEGGGLPGPLRALVRTVLLCLVIPAVVTDPTGRGVHDRVARTTINRLISPGC